MGSVSYVLQGKPDLPRTAASAAADWVGAQFMIAGTPTRVVAGVFTEAAAQTDWRVSVMGRVGLTFGGADGRRSMSVSVVTYDGVSTQRQFYDASSRYIGGELRFDL